MMQAFERYDLIAQQNAEYEASLRADEARERAEDEERQRGLVRDSNTNVIDTDVIEYVSEDDACHLSREELRIARLRFFEGAGCDSVPSLTATVPPWEDPVQKDDRSTPNTPTTAPSEPIIIPHSLVMQAYHSSGMHSYSRFRKRVNAVVDARPMESAIIRNGDDEVVTITPENVCIALQAMASKAFLRMDELEVHPNVQKLALHVRLIDALLPIAVDDTFKRTSGTNAVGGTSHHLTTQKWADRAKGIVDTMITSTQWKELLEVCRHPCVSALDVRRAHSAVRGCYL